MSRLTSDKRLAEECMYIYKYLPGQIEELSLYLDSLLPPAPGSVLKMTGRPVAKAPGDPSQTETWGIIRAIAREATILDSKARLRGVIGSYRGWLEEPDTDLVRLLYDKELPALTVQDKLGLTRSSFFRIRGRILQGLCPYILPLENIEDGLLHLEDK